MGLDAFTNGSVWNHNRFPLQLIPHSYSLFFEMRVSIRRIEAFLNLEEAPRVTQFHALKDDCETSPPVAVGVHWDTLWWSANRAALLHVKAEVAAGALVGVVGVVGAGKTAFLLGLLRELRCTKDANNSTAAVVGSAVGYCSQEPAILNGTLRDNVTFGLPFKTKEYDAAITAACLDADLKTMPAGHDTEIGERGVNLSGGQKARVVFARTLYHRNRCGLFLFDDPFAAVDVHVGKNMFDRGIVKHLQGCTRVVVVNSQTDLLRSCSTILELKDSKIVVRGTGEEVFRGRPGGNSIALVGGELPLPGNGGAAAKEGPTATEIYEGKNLTKTETRARGAVRSEVYTSYFGFAYKGHASTTGILVLLMYLVGQVIRVMSDVWLTWWSDTSDGADSEAPDFVDGRSDAWFIISLGIWNGSNIVLTFTRSFICVLLAMRTSAGVHQAVLGNILRAPLVWFQQNPPGKILNRLSTDLMRVDTLLPDTLYQFLDNFFVLVTAVVLALVAIPWLLLLLLPYAAILYTLQKYHRAASRELLRLDGTTKTPLFGLFGETMQNRTTIRAFETQGMMLRRERSLANKNLKIYFHVKMLERWISVYLNLSVSILGVVLVLVAVFTKKLIDPALVGLALVYCLQLMGLSAWTVMLFVQLESHMTSLERLLELCKVPPQETPALRGSKITTPEGWPADGAIKFSNVKLQYRSNLPLALKGVQFSIKAREKIGVCGRTGAGKSSILMVLFRLFEPLSESSVVIDGIECMGLPLHHLRSALAVIPQDPIIFNGSLRTNLDPFAKFSDQEIWKVLEKVTLRRFVERLPDQLDEKVGSNGGQLSLGQKQLICIARAMLKKSRVLLCDEATSSVDQETDQIIQQIIRTEFVNHTVLTIAHRLDTIIDCDRIMVLNDGVVAEIESPTVLLADPDSLFSQMANKAGITSVRLP